MTDHRDELLRALRGDPDLRRLLREEMDALERAESSRGATRQGAGRHHPKNNLNDLTGAEWLFFLNSVESTAYPSRGPGALAHEVRRIHPSPKPPQLMEKIIRFFTRRGEWVLDPFAGVGGTLIGASLAERKAVGLELDPRYAAAYRDACAALDLATAPMLEGDARSMDDLLRDCPSAPDAFDLVLTDPPYGDMLSRPQSGEVKKKTGRSVATPFTDSALDLGNLDRGAFLRSLAGIIGLAAARLRARGHVVLFCKDLQPANGEHNMLHVHVVEALNGRCGLRFLGYKIWHDRTLNLYPFGYPHAFVANQLHQFILVFRKEDAQKTAKAA